MYICIYVCYPPPPPPPPHAPTLQHGFQIKILGSALRVVFKGGRDSHRNSSRSDLNNLLEIVDCMP